MGLISKAFLSGLRFGKSPNRVLRTVMDTDQPYNKKTVSGVLEFAKRYNNKTLVKAASFWLSRDKRFTRQELEGLMTNNIVKMGDRYNLGRVTTAGAVGSGVASSYMASRQNKRGG